MPRTPCQTEAQAIALELDALRARAQRTASDFGDLAFTQVVGLLETARVTMVNRMHADDQTNHPPPREPSVEAFADKVLDAEIFTYLEDRPRRLEGHGCAVLRRIAPEEARRIAEEA